MNTITTADLRERCRRELWLALGYLPDQLPSSGWEAAIEAVKRQTQQLAAVRKIVR
jgi:hypothetical protein